MMGRERRLANLTQAGRGRVQGSKNKITKLRQTLFDKACPPDKTVQVIEALVRKAIKGDAKAAQLLLEYKFGKPRQALEVTHAGVQRIDFIIEREREP